MMNEMLTDFENIDYLKRIAKSLIPEHDEVAFNIISDLITARFEPRFSGVCTNDCFQLNKEKIKRLYGYTDYEIKEGVFTLRYFDLITKIGTGRYLVNWHALLQVKRIRDAITRLSA